MAILLGNWWLVSAWNGLPDGFCPSKLQVSHQFLGVWSRQHQLVDSLALRSCWFPPGGFHHGATPIAGWFISWKIPISNGWWFGGPPILGNLRLVSLCIARSMRREASVGTDLDAAFLSLGGAPGGWTRCLPTLPGDIGHMEQPLSWEHHIH